MLTKEEFDVLWEQANKKVQGMADTLARMRREVHADGSDPWLCEPYLRRLTAETRADRIRQAADLCKELGCEYTVSDLIDIADGKM